jgi:hypothetical protein
MEYTFSSTGTVDEEYLKPVPTPVITDFVVTVGASETLAVTHTEDPQRQRFIQVLAGNYAVATGVTVTRTSATVTTFAFTSAGSYRIRIMVH